MTSGIIFDIQRFALGNGPGIRTAVFIKGCPLHCPWCRYPEARRKDPELAYLAYRCIGCGVCARVCPNHAVQLKVGEPHILRDRCVVCGKCADACVSGALMLIGSAMTVEEVMADVRKDCGYYAKTGGGLTITGGEPFQQEEFLFELLSAAKAEGIHTCLETNGNAPRASLERILPLTDCFIFDFKATGRDYQELSGVDEKFILLNLDFLYKQGKGIILRCPLVPGVNDSPQHLEGIARLERVYPDLLGIEILPYRDTYASKFERFGYINPLPDLKSASKEACQGWLSALAEQGCTRAVILPG